MALGNTLHTELRKNSVDITAGGLKPLTEAAKKQGVVVVKPFGGVVVGPLYQEKGILYATIDPEAAPSSRNPLDVSGHYGRPDIFHLEIDRCPMPPTMFVDENN